jgi:hypothetical protein
VIVGNCHCRAGPLPPGDSDLTLQLSHMAFRQRGCSMGVAFIPSFVKISRLVEMEGGGGALSYILATYTRSVLIPCNKPSVFILGEKRLQPSVYRSELLESKRMVAICQVFVCL